MKIEFVEIQNFRKLKSCHISFSENQTVFVGANNSGKTSAMDILILFLKKSKRKDITTTDFTLSNWSSINKIGDSWIDNNGDENPDFKIEPWLPLLPILDIWIKTDNSEIHYVNRLIPTLSWAGGNLGVRFCFEPKNDEKLEELYRDYKKAFDSAKELTKNESNLSLWPQSLKDFLDKDNLLHRYFSINAYILDPDKIEDPVDGVAFPQKLPKDSFVLDFEPFHGLFKIDVINAQRGFFDANTSDDAVTGNTVGNLSTQLRSYYDKHLNPSENPTHDDIGALIAIEKSTKEFDKKLKESFGSAISELETLGYPGFSDPEISLTSKVDPIDGLNHDSAVQYNISRIDDDSEQAQFSLPERYNGLGYQNLVSMVFKLIRFRDEWMKKGKAKKATENDDIVIEPLHLVLIEEPEAHLHAQVQQVFIKKAYEVLRNHKDLGESTTFTTQLLVSSHSSHIAHEIEFSCLRYFRRNSVVDKNDVPCATVVNLSKTFGPEDETAKFVTRYLKTTHCDLFFADAVIIVEGPAERMLVPYFIKNIFPKLDSLYLTILEIGGSHAHRLKPLIEDLGVLTLIVTDIDSIDKTGKSKIQPERKKEYKSGNNTLKDWLPKESDLDKLLDMKSAQKTSKNSLIRVAYQYPFNIHFTKDNSEEVIPYTFEDALVFSNIELFKSLTKSKGLIKKMSESLSEASVHKSAKAMFGALDSGKKAEMALELLYLKEPGELVTPYYISEGLEWLHEKLKSKNEEFLIKDDKCDEAKK